MSKITGENGPSDPFISTSQVYKKQPTVSEKRCSSKKPKKDKTARNKFIYFTIVIITVGAIIGIVSAIYNQSSEKEISPLSKDQGLKTGEFIIIHIIIFAAFFV